MCPTPHAHNHASGTHDHAHDDANDGAGDVHGDEDGEVEEFSQDDILKLYEKAGAAGKKMKDRAKEIVKPGAKLLAIAEELEGMTKKLGCTGAAFPLNLSINDQAAHYSPTPDDESVVKEGDVVKVDMGVHADGFLVDFAYTANFSDNPAYAKLVAASQEALENAIATARAGVPVSKIGKVIADTAAKHGFKPISNLGGHTVERYTVHAGQMVPNIERGSYVLQEGDVIAIEPFITDGKGYVNETDFVQIYSLMGDAKTRSPSARMALDFIAEEYQTLPFAVRNLIPAVGSAGLAKLAIKELERLGAVQGYPMLKEEGRGQVAQTETTMKVEKDGVKVFV